MRMSIAVVALTACAQKDALTSRDAPPPPPPPPVEVPAKPTDLLLEPGVEMRRPVRDGNLTLIPLVKIGRMSEQHVITLVEGMANHTVAIRELSHHIRTSYIQVRNKNTLPLFIDSGELVLDGLQDRVTTAESYIPPGETAEVQVACVEQNREQGHMELHAPGIMAETRVRQHAAYSDQAMLWAHIVELNREHHFAPVMGSYRQVAELQSSTEPSARRDALAHQLAVLPDRDHLVGLIAVTGTKIFAYDRYVSAELYGQLEHELLGSYIASDDATPTESTVTPADVRLFAQLQKRGTPASWTIVVRP